MLSGRVQTLRILLPVPRYYINASTSDCTIRIFRRVIEQRPQVRSWEVAPREVVLLFLGHRGIVDDIRIDAVHFRDPSLQRVN